jgi:ELWxxDGT repeat protein
MAVTNINATEAAGGLAPGQLRTINGLLFFSGNDGVHGSEPWLSDGTAGGSRMIADVNPGGGGSNPQVFTAFGNQVFFSADDGTHGQEPWILTPQALQLLKATGGQTLAATAGSAVTANPLATFTDPNGDLAAGQYQAAIDWGDGTSTSAGSISGPDANGVFTVSGVHTYAAVAPTPDTITVTLSRAGAPSTSVTDSVSVAGPVNFTSTGGAVSVTLASGNLEILAGANVVSSAPLANVTSVTINGANGVANSFTLDYSGGTFIVPGGITFNGGALPGTPSNSLTILGGAFDTDTFDFSATHNGSIQLGTNGQVVNYTNLTPLANTGTAANAVFKLPDGTVVATLDAGATAGTVELVSGNGTFETTTFAVPSGSLTVNSGNGSDTVTTTSAFYNNFKANLTVNGAANALSVHAIAAGTLAATEGAAVSQMVATFSDPNGSGTASSYTATINWGDGTSTSPGSISGPDASGLFTVTGSHTYAEASAAGETLSVVVHRPNAADSTATGLAKVADAPLTGTASSVTATAQATFSGTVATFTDGNVLATAGDFAAAIAWGDGATTWGSVSAASTGFQVAGSHVYATSGPESITVVVNDVGGNSATINSATTVAAGGTPHQRYVTAVYESVLGREPDAGGLAYWSNLLDQGAAIASVAYAIVHSVEYYANFVIQPDYQKLLGRAADSGGLQYWTTQMQNGLTDQQLQAQFVASDEFYMAAGGTPLAWIDAIYKLVLGRAPEPAGEKYWAGYLSTLIASEPGPAARLQLALVISNSQESNTNLVNDDYFHYLGRAADLAGLNYWLQQFANGETNEDVVADFTGSAEYYNGHTG